MSLIPITDRRASEEAFRALKKRLAEGCKKFTRRIGWKGGNYEDVIYWNPRQRFWFTHYVGKDSTRFWCPYGTWDPETHQMLTITVECNPPCKGVDRRCAGAFLTDGSKVYIAHSGKIGGGREGIGKNAFVDSYPQGNWRTVEWPDGYENEMIVIGRVDGKRLPLQFSEFIREVKKFKESVEESDQQPTGNGLKSGFWPEFSGKRKKYHVNGDIESSCDHGIVVNELEKCLRRLKVSRIGKNQALDLYVLSKQNLLNTLFEVKSDVSTSSVYQGVGQLLYHSASSGKTPRKIFVLPEKPKAKTQAVLDALSIEVLTFRWKGSTPVFHDLKGLLK
jgi:hypothetical protein